MARSPARFARACPQLCTHSPSPLLHPRSASDFPCIVLVPSFPHASLGMPSLDARLAGASSSASPPRRSRLAAPVLPHATAQRLTPYVVARRPPRCSSPPARRRSTSNSLRSHSMPISLAVACDPPHRCLLPPRPCSVSGDPAVVIVLLDPPRPTGRRRQWAARSQVAPHRRGKMLTPADGTAAVQLPLNGSAHCRARAENRRSGTCT